MTTNLVVADLRRTEKTICLAVTPSLKAYGISGRARLFEVVQKVAEVNAKRRQAAPGRQLTGLSWNDPEVQHNPSLALDYIVAPPRMAHYIDWSTKIYGVYLKYLAPEDIFPYSIDEVFMDVTNYLDTYKMTARDLARTIILDILKTTGITAAAGMGPNLYLAKIAMDIVAKRVHPDKDGVRIAKLNETTYRKLLWAHRPLTDFGGLAEAMPPSWKPMAYTPWVILPVAPSGNRQTITMRRCSIGSLESTQSCSLIMPGAGNPVP